MTYWQSRGEALRALLKKELLCTLKEKSSRMILIVPIVAYIILFGYIASFNLDKIPYALLDESGTPASEALVRDIELGTNFQRVATLRSVSEIAATVDAGEAMLVLVIEPNFAQHQAQGRVSEVMAILDGRNSSTAQLAAGYVSNIVQQANAKLTGVSMPLTTRLLYNPNNITQWFILPGLIVMLSMLQIIVLSALSVAREREQGTFEQLLVSPYRTEELLFAKALIPVMIGLFQSTLIFIVDRWWFDVPIAGTVLRIYFVLFVFILSIVGLGLAISAASQTMQMGLLRAFALLVPMVLLSGFFTSVENMPRAIQMLTWFNPLRFAVLAVRRIYLADASWGAVLTMSWPMIAMSVVTLPIAYHYFKKR